MKVTRILHASVNVEGDLVDTVAFYRDLLGLGDDERPDIPGIDGHWFRVGDAQVHLVDGPTGSGPIRPSDHHFCVAVADLDATVAELDRRGVQYLRGEIGGIQQVFLADPSGNTVELQQDRPL